MILQTIHCSVSGCDNQYKEKKFNEGFKGWGEIRGLVDDETNEVVAHLCPEHLQKAARVLNNDLG